MLYVLLLLFVFLALKAFFFVRRKKGIKKGISLLLGTLYLACITFLLSLLALKKPENVCITLTGKLGKETLEWKNPCSPMQKAELTTYEVQISSEHFQKRAFFFGEVVGIRIKTLQLHPFLHLIGATDPARIECLQSDYICIDKMRSFPTMAIAIDAPFSASIVWSLWEKLFYKHSSFLGLCFASLQTEYIPLVDGKGNPSQISYFFPK